MLATLIGAGFGCFVMLIELAIIVVVVAGVWKAFEKAGQPGWAAIIPIYNLYIIVLISGKEWWWMLLFFIPFVNIVIAILVSIEIAKKFGQSPGFGVGLALLGFIFWPILGFGDAQYIGPRPPSGFPPVV
jgi:hypothetical protein